MTSMKRIHLALLSGAVANYLAACEPAIPCGFWDRQPKSTAGRLRRVLAQIDLAMLPPLPPLPIEVRQKASRTEHLPKGREAQRRTRSHTMNTEPLLATSD